MLPPDDLQTDIIWRDIALHKCTSRLYHQYPFEANLWSEGIGNKDIKKRNERSFATMYQERTFFLW